MAHAQGAEAKAAFLLNFARYVEWPTPKLSTDQPIRLCLLGRGALGDAAGSVEGRQAQGREVHVRALGLPEQAFDCHVLFLAASQAAQAAAAIRLLEGEPVLTVSDAEGFAVMGGHIGLVAEGERMRFDVNLAAMQRSRLKAGATLLQVARNILAPEAH